jgi:hypothetical protein
MFWWTQKICGIQYYKGEQFARDQMKGNSKEFDWILVLSNCYYYAFN